MERLLRVKQVAEQLGVSKSTVWNLVAQGRLVKPKKITPSTSAWKESDIQEFIESL